MSHCLDGDCVIEGCETCAAFFKEIDAALEMYAQRKLRLQKAAEAKAKFQKEWAARAHEEAERKATKLKEAKEKHEEFAPPYAKHGSSDANITSSVSVPAAEPARPKSPISLADAQAAKRKAARLKEAKEKQEAWRAAYVAKHGSLDANTPPPPVASVPVPASEPAPPKSPIPLAEARAARAAASGKRAAPAPERVEDEPGRVLETTFHDKVREVTATGAGGLRLFQPTLRTLLGTPGTSGKPMPESLPRPPPPGPTWASALVDNEAVVDDQEADDSDDELEVVGEDESLDDFIVPDSDEDDNSVVTSSEGSEEASELGYESDKSVKVESAKKRRVIVSDDEE